MGISYDLVVDGKIMEKNLKIRKKLSMVKKQVEKFNIRPEEALVVTLDGKGQIFVKKRKRKIGGENMYKETIFSIIIIIIVVVGNIVTQNYTNYSVKRQHLN